MISPPDTAPRRDLACQAAAAAGWVCFILLCVFYGSDVNVVVFFGAIFALMSGLSLVAPRLAKEAHASPVTFALPALAIVGIVVSYQFSLSKDSSFVPAWVVAVTPLAFLLARGAGEAAFALHKAVSLTVLAFAAISVVLLFSAGARARLPLTDPNNYATLLCLILLPWLHRYFVLRTGSQGMSLRVEGKDLSACFILALALFATGSRAGLLVIAGAFIIWAGLAIARRLSWRPVAAAAALTAAAYLLAGAALTDQSVALTAQAAAADRVAGADIEVRMALIGSALAMYAEYPATGIGLFVFPLLYRFQRPVVDQDSAGLYVHNDYLQLLLEGGPLLFCAMVTFAVVVVIVFFRRLAALPGDEAFARLGLTMGVGAALAHALVNFVVYSPALGFVLGLTVAAAFRDSKRSGSVDSTQARPIRVAITLAVLFGWTAWLYLGLDTATAGVLQSQRYVPFTEQVRKSPERMLRFAGMARSLNADRGVPLLAEAALLDNKLRQNPESRYLGEETLNAFRRAEQADPWNTLTLLLMADFIMRNPSVLPLLENGEAPEELLLRTLVMDPQFVPGIDALMERLAREGRHAEAEALLRLRVYPWLRLLARQNKPAAARYVEALLAMARARGDADFVSELEARQEEVENTQPVIAERWFF
jgi:O-antigen ligase